MHYLDRLDAHTVDLSVVMVKNMYIVSLCRCGCCGGDNAGERPQGCAGGAQHAAGAVPCRATLVHSLGGFSAAFGAGCGGKHTGGHARAVNKR